MNAGDRSASTALDRQVQLAAQMADLLDQEYQALIDGNGDQISTLVERKTAGIQELESFKLPEPLSEPDRERLRKAMTRLQQANLRNGATLHVKQSYARWALERLRGGDEPELYGRAKQGSIHACRRLIGQA